MKKFTIGLSVCAAALLIGCGGGGSGSSSSSSTTANGQSTDEIMANAKVTIYAGSLKGKILATTRTSNDTNGRYSADLGSYKGPILVKTECDANTTLYNFNGTKIGKCNLTTPLYSAAIVGNSGSITASVSPFTTAMVYAAVPDGNLSQPITPEQLQKARIAVATAYGLNTDPVSIIPSDSEAYKNKIKTFDDIDKNHTALIHAMVKDAKTGKIGTDLNSTIKTKLNVKDVNVSDMNASDAPILTAKGTFNTLRTTVNNISNSDGTGSVDKEVNKISNDFKNLSVDVDSAVTPLGNIINMIGQKKFEKLSDGNITIDTNDNKTYTYTIEKTNGGKYTGTIVFNANFTGTDLTKNFDYTAKIKDAELPYNDTNTDKKQILTGNLELKNDASSKMVYLTLNNVQLVAKDEQTISIDKIDADMKYSLNSNNEPDPKYVEVNTIKLSGNVLNKYDVNVTLSANYTKTANTNLAFDQEYVKVEGGVDCIDSDKNYVNEQPTGYVKYKTKAGNWIKLQTTNSWGDGFWFASEYNDYNGLKQEQYAGYDSSRFDLSNAKCPNSDTPEIFRIETNYNDNFYNGGVVPNKLTLTGDIKDTKNNMELNGNIIVSSDDIKNIDLSKENQKLGAKLDANVVLKRPDYADTSLIIAGNYFPSGAGNLDINFKYADASYIDVNAKWNSDESGRVKITSLNGFRTTLPVNKEGDIDFTNPIYVYINNSKVGKIQQNGDLYRIKYNDGSFESLQ